MRTYLFKRLLRTKFGAAKRASTLGKCNVAERACTLCSYIGKFSALSYIALSEGCAQIGKEDCTTCPIWRKKVNKSPS